LTKFIGNAIYDTGPPLLETISWNDVREERAYGHAREIINVWHREPL
jgi:hypothetical protein